ncbi:hypothetical protein E4U15_003500 [Claviceps sp. LM218 group G6]|nr:hypothetical protein E4U15_003500 [Claviceps sp. LM218 group G6]
MDNGDGKRVDHSRASQAPASHPAIGSSVTNPSQLATPGADAGSGAAPPTIAKYASHHPKFLMLLPPSPNAPPTIAKGSSHHLCSVRVPSAALWQPGMAALFSRLILTEALPSRKTRRRT